MFSKTSLASVVVLSLAWASGAQAAPWFAKHGQTSAEYQKTFDDAIKKGYRLMHVSGYNVGGKALYASIFEKSAGPALVARHGLTSAQYQAEFDKLTKQGYRLKVVSGYEDGGGARYAAIFEKSGGPAWFAKHGQTSAEYQKTFDDAIKKGYRLLLVNGYSVGGKAYYASIFEKSNGPAFVARHGLTSAQYQAEFDKLTKQGYRLKLVSGYEAGNAAHYAAIFEKTNGPALWARHGLTAAQYQTEFDIKVGQGYRLTLVSAYSVNNQARFAAIWSK